MKNMFSFTNTICQEELIKFSFLYEAIPSIKQIILSTIEKLPKDEFNYIHPNIWIHKSAKIDNNTKIIGPCIIDKGAIIRHSCLIRENVVIGKNCLIGNSIELKNTILFDEVKIPHLSYVGDSLLGYKVHLGASSLISNKRLDDKEIVIEWKKEKINTHSTKFGALIGDYVEIGCSSVINPGSIIGNNTFIYPLSSIKGTIDPYMVIKGDN
ncbi:MAG: hypothetical protein PUA56_02435 [Bacillales bacterium]|nr:hypothetical protein [Bacillales bacterium]